MVEHAMRLDMHVFVNFINKNLKIKHKSTKIQIHQYALGKSTQEVFNLTDCVCEITLKVKLNTEQLYIPWHTILSNNEPTRLIAWVNCFSLIVSNPNDCRFIWPRTNFHSYGDTTLILHMTNTWDCNTHTLYKVQFIFSDQR